MKLGTDNGTKLNFTAKTKEQFSVELDKTELSLTLRVNGVTRNTITLGNANDLFDDLLQTIKNKFLKLRDTGKIQ
jgi:hypothetical protein